MQMRSFALAISLLCVSFIVRPQSPVQWSYSAKKLANGTYEIHLTARIESPWHIYSQTTPDGGPIPTKISFTKNPVVSLQGEAKELGTLHQRHEDVFGVDVKYFDEKVDFVQVVTVRPFKTLRQAQGDRKIKTVCSGAIEYMVCNDEQCLPPTC